MDGYGKEIHLYLDIENVPAQPKNIEHRVEGNVNLGDGGEDRNAIKNGNHGVDSDFDDSVYNLEDRDSEGNGTDDALVEKYIDKEVEWSGPNAENNEGNGTDSNDSSFLDYLMWWQVVVALRVITNQMMGLERKDK